MKKINFLFLLLIPIALYVGCAKGSQTIGPKGPAGAAGTKGSAPTNIGSSIQLNSSSFHGVAPYEVINKRVSIDPTQTYMLSAYISSNNAPSFWYKLPAFNVISQNDEVYATLGYDTVKIWYFNEGSVWQDSSFTCNYIVVPVTQ